MRPPSDEAARIATALRVDGLAREVIDTFDRAGTRSILLRGPSTAQFYRHHIRSYGDVDLLVEPRRWDEATQTLHELGFTRHRPPAPDAHAESFGRGPLEVVDLHRTVIGVTCAPSHLFETLAPLVGPGRSSPSDLPLLQPAAALLICILHVAHHGTADSKPIDDLAMALDSTTWEQVVMAHELAASLGAIESFNAGLRITPAGSAAADRLSLDPRAALPERLRANSAPPAAWTIARLRRSDTRMADLRSLLFPHPREFGRRAWVRRLPHRGPGLLVTYPVWFARVAYETLRSIWWAARHARRM